MRVELGERICTLDDKEVGYVKNLIVDPAENRIKAVVIEQGFLFKQDTEAPLDALVECGENRICLNLTEEQWNHLPGYDPSGYTSTPEDVSTGLGYPTSALLWPAINPYPGSVMGQAVMPLPLVPLETPPSTEAEATGIKIKEGSPVRTADGHKVGEVHHLAFDVVTGRPISLTVRRGLLFGEDIELPAAEIAEMAENEVLLGMTEAEFKEWEKAPSVPFV